MKQFLLVFLFSLSISAISQNDSIKSSIKELSFKIKHSQKTEKLKWMDSLTSLVINNSELKYDSIVRQTINYAKSLDSISNAGKHTANLIYYYNNVIGKPKEGLAVFQDFMSEYNKFENDNVLGLLYINTADSYYFIGEIETSIEYYNIAGNYALKNNDKRLLGLSNLYMGYSHSDLGQFSEASKRMKVAAEFFREVKDTFNLIGSKIGVAIQYSQVNFLEEADNERKEAIELAKLSKNYASLVSLYYNAATDYRFAKKTQERVDFIEAALAISDSANISIQTKHLLYTNLVVACVENNKKEKAESYFKEVLKFSKLHKEGKSNESFIEAKKFLFYARGDYAKAIKLGKEHLEFKQKRKQYGEILQAHKFLNAAYVALGNKNMAYNHIVSYSQLKDSISNAKNIKSLAFYQTLYETEKRDLKIQAQESNIALLSEKNKIKNQYIAFGSIGLFAIFGFVLLVRSRNKEKQQQKLQQQFSHDLLQSQENERTRIAKELHDSVGQQLTLIKKKSQNVNQEDISKLTNNALEEVRSISRGLYPAMLKQLGLKESIEQLVYEYDEETDLFFTSEIDDIDNFFDEPSSLNFYRFIQECLTNIIKHANAKTVSLSIMKQGSNIVTLLSDNGKGFDIKDKRAKNSLGLKTIFERINILKGELIIDSVQGKGTIIKATIPIKNE